MNKALIGSENNKRGCISNMTSSLETCLSTASDTQSFKDPNWGQGWGTQAKNTIKIVIKPDNRKKFPGRQSCQKCESKIRVIRRDSEEAVEFLQRQSIRY